MGTLFMVAAVMYVCKVNVDLGAHDMRLCWLALQPVGYLVYPRLPFQSLTSWVPIY